MLRSIRSQLIFASSILIILILGATAYFVIEQKIKEINHSIFQNASHYAELTAERIVNSYERYYREKAFANFDRELADIYALNSDIDSISIYNYQGETLYIPSVKTKEPIRRNDPSFLERLQSFYPSVKIKGSDRIVYLQNENGTLRSTNANGRDVTAVQSKEQIVDVIYPFRDGNNQLRSYSIQYGVSYAYLTSRIRETATNIVILAIFGIITALLMGVLIAGRITSPIKILSKGVQIFGRGDLTHRIHVHTKSEIGVLASTFNQMADDLEENTKELIVKERQTKEIELAVQIQRELLPKNIPIVPNLDLAVSTTPAAEMGGDCYDFIPIDENNLLFYVGDVTGHGIPAGIVAAINNALVPALLEHHKDLKDLVVNLNRVLKKKTRPNVFMTMVTGLWNIKDASLTFVQAGHDPIVQYVNKNKKAKSLASGGMALAMIPDVSKITKTEVAASAKEDVFVIYSDGIPEAWHGKEEYGMDRFRASIEKNSTLATAQAIHDAILKDVRAFMGDHPQEDDITLLVMKRTK